ncbi:MAG: Dihydrofolate synthase (EC @ Folylpolyglutamate synthase (EC [uncultured Campylobacterales bacterium]|uniref:Dihydrofolate synthase ) n=1 Tax=uncultured Campylobacterales bacterium TaxID=352960 RepID=A0A6S6T3P4_9BACT|nr:MAG: Dihydrofolate synthase (EC @ Folylpolyglutamate synthase (EC [uncultured Campylobacterales bacterium]
MSFKEVLESKNLDYTATNIDYQRFPSIYASLKDNLQNSAKKIQLIGTNGKGSTGRFVALLLRKEGFNVAHFTSPHISDIRERFWYNGNLISTDLLDSANQELCELIHPDKLSYFEYCFLIFLLAFRDCDYMVIEAGLGGEYDATSTLTYDIQLITKIGLDHQSFLGNTVKKIATTKLKAIDKKAIIGIQDKEEVEIVAKSLNKDISYLDTNINIINKKYNIDEFVEANSLAKYFKENIALALACIEYLDITTTLEDIKFDLQARLQKISDNLYIDVGHNVSAANEILKHFKNKKINLIYNTYKDKEYENILAILKPIIKKVYLFEITHPRIEKPQNLIQAFKNVGLDYAVFDRILDEEKYLVFGSFTLIEKFLKHRKIIEA